MYYKYKSKMTISEKKITARLLSLMENLGVNKTQMAEKLDIKPQNFSKYLLEQDVPHRRNPEMLASKLTTIGVNADWYLTGKGEMFVKDIPSRDEMSKHYEKIGRTVHDVLMEVLRKEEKATTLRQIAEDTVDRKKSEKASIPLYLHAIAAGPPADSTSPVEEYLELPKRMIAHPKETYAVTACGDSMTGAGIEEGDILIVDTAIEPQHKNIVIASVNGEQTVKRLSIEGGKIKLMPENSHYDPIEITKGMHFKTQGVVIWVIRKTG